MSRMTQQQLAEKAGVSTKTVIRAEQGVSPREASMRVMAQALEVSVETLWPSQVDEQREAA